MSKLSRFKATSPELFHMLADVLAELITSSGHTPDAKEKIGGIVEVFRAVTGVDAPPKATGKVAAKVAEQTTK